MTREILEEDNRIYIFRELTFKVQDIASDSNYEFIVEVPKGGWTFTQASHTAYNIMENICTGCMVDVYFGEELMASTQCCN